MAANRVRLKERSAARSGSGALDAALGAVAGSNPFEALQTLARVLPVAASVETVDIRLRATDAGRLFHLVAIEGSTPRERRTRALEPTSLSLMRSRLALRAHHSLASAAGIRWIEGRWIRSDQATTGVLLVGSRTERRPNEEERALVGEAARRLGPALRAVDRRSATLTRVSRRLAQEAATYPSEAGGAVLDVLRPRERAVLALYTEGLGAQEIAQLLFLSPHTVRTHVKNAFRRLGVHTRDEAARLVYTDEVLRLL